MSDISKYVAGEIVKSGDSPVRKEVGGALVKTGAATGGLMLVSALPFITLPMLVVLLVVFGGFLYLK